MLLSQITVVVETPPPPPPHTHTHTKIFLKELWCALTTEEGCSKNQRTLRKTLFLWRKCLLFLRLINIILEPIIILCVINEGFIFVKIYSVSLVELPLSNGCHQIFPLDSVVLLVPNNCMYLSNLINKYSHYYYFV